MPEFTERELKLVEQAAETYGFPIKGYQVDEDGEPEANLGRFRILEDDEDYGLFEGDEGILTIHIVGAPQYGNKRAAFLFVSDETGFPDEIQNPAFQVEPI